MTFLLMLSALLAGSLNFSGSDAAEDQLDTEVNGAEDAGPADVAEVVSLDQYLEGTDENDLLQGQNGDDTLFGAEGADTLAGGAGDDLLFGGDDALFGDDWNHQPGEMSLVDTAGDLLQGGDGDDTIYLGPNAVATGGAGADHFVAFGLGYFGDNEAAEITDFTAGEDRLEIDYAVHSGFFTQDFSTEDAVDSFQNSYDEATDTTTVAIDGQDIVTLNGDQTGLRVAFHDGETDPANPVWLDIEGNEMTADEGEAADLILVARALQDLIGEQS